MRALLADRNARLYLLGQAFSLFGDSALWLAMGIWVKTLTRSNGAAGLVFFFFTAPALLAPAAGLVVDRVRRRPLLIAANMCAGGAVLLLFLVRGPGQVWLIYLVMALYGLLYIVLGSAQSALLTVMLPGELLPDANAALRTIQESLRLVTPLAGAGLFVLAGPHVVAITDAATFAVPVACLAAIRLAEPSPTPRARRWRAEVAAGFSHIWRTPSLRQLVIAAAGALTVFGFMETAIYAIAAQGLREPAAFVGVLGAIQGAGSIAGGLAAAPLMRRTGETWLVGIGLTGTAVAAVLAVPPLFAAVFPGLFLFGVSLPWLVVGATTLLQRRTPPHLQGRAYAAAEALITTPQAISIATGAALIGVAGYRILLAAVAAVTGLAAAYLFTRPTAHLGKPLAAYATGTAAGQPGINWHGPDDFAGHPVGVSASKGIELRRQTVGADRDNRDVKLRRLREGDVLDDDDMILVRGGEPDLQVLQADALRYHAAYGSYGISVFAVRGATLDELAQQVPLVRFGRLTLIKVAAVRKAGLRLEPTGRNPRHFTVGFDELDRGAALLVGCEHQVVPNPYHDA